MFSMYNANDVRHLAMLAGLQFLISNKYSNYCKHGHLWSSKQISVQKT